MPGPILHVVYAGRGDAMILETDADGVGPNRQFILVDGGPRNYHSGGSAGEAPYNRYLLSACRDILPAGGDLAGVVISHPDEDHFGGYTYNLQQGRMVQPAALFMPASAAVWPNDNWPVQKWLEGPMRDVGYLSADAYSPYLIPPVKPIYPQTARIQYYYSTTAGRPGTNIGGHNPGTTKNERSILMYTKTPNGPADELGIFFTGDSHADIIAREMRREFPHLAIPRFAIYKIQHHGSIYDNVLAFYNPMFTHSSQSELFILCLLRVNHDAGYLSDPENDGPSAQVASRVLIQVIKDELEEAENVWTGTAAFYDALTLRVKAVQVHQLETLQPGPLPPNAPDTYIVPPTPDAHVPALTLDAEDLLRTMDQRLRQMTLPNRAHWTKFRDNRSADFMTYLHVRSVKKFYLTFEADVYVVSANAKYHHPRCETLVGLALAVREQNRKARLYVTNGQSIDVYGIRRLLMLMDLGDATELFDTNYLRIAYLATGTYMSISGESRDLNADPQPNVNRDIGGKTEIIRIQSWNRKAEREALHQLFEKLPDLALLKTVKCVFVCLNDPLDETTRRYLYPIYTNGGQLEWLISPVGGAVQYTFVDLDTVSVMPNLLNTIRARKDRFGPKFEDFNWVAARQNAQGQYLWHITSVNGAEAIYRNPFNGEILIGALPLGGAQLVEFYIEQIADNAGEGVDAMEALADDAAGVEAPAEMVDEEMVDEDETAAGIDASPKLIGDTSGPAIAPMEAVVQARSMPTTFSALVAEDKGHKGDKAATVGTDHVANTDGVSSRKDASSGVLARVLAAIASAGRDGPLDVLSEEDKLVIIQALRVADSRTSLRTAFKETGDLIHQVDKPGLIQTMTRLFSSKDALRDVFLRKVPEVALSLGLDKLMVDLDKSVAVMAVRPAYGQTIDRTTIVCQSPSGQLQWPYKVEMGGFSLSIQEVVFQLKHCRTPLATVAIEGSVALLVKGTAGLELSMSWSSSSAETAISFRASVTSIPELVKALSESGDALSDILNLELPLMNSQGGQPAPTLGSKAVPMHSVGFTLVQPTDSVEQYVLNDIWLRTTFTDWKTFLPVPDKFKDVDGEAFVQVLNPFQRKSRRIAATVHLDVPIPAAAGAVTKSGRSVTADFCAIPLAGPGEYQYRFRIGGTNGGVTVPEAAAAIGLADVSAEITGAVPALKKVFDAVRIRELGVAVGHGASGWSFEQWTVDLHVPAFEILPGTLVLSDAYLRLEKLPDELRANGEAVFRSSKVESEAVIAFALPSAGTEGHVTFVAPGGLSLADVFGVFDLGDLDAVPVLGELATVEIMHCKVGLEVGANGGLTVPTFSAKFHKSKFSIGPLKLESVEFEVSWRRAKSEEGAERESALSFQTVALFENVPATVTVAYDGEKKTLSAGLRSATNGSLKVADLLGLLLPGIDSALHDLFGDLAMQETTITLDVKEKRPTAFHIRFTDGAEMRVPSVKEDKFLALRSLSLDYVEAAEVPPKPEEPPARPEPGSQGLGPKQPETKQPDTKQPDTKQPEAKQPEAKQPEAKQPEAKQPEGPKAEKYSKLDLHAMLDIHTGGSSGTTVGMAATLTAVSKKGGNDRTIDFAIAVVVATTNDGQPTDHGGRAAGTITNSPAKNDPTKSESTKNDPGFAAFASHLGLDLNDGNVAKPDQCPSFGDGLAAIRGKFTTIDSQPPAPPADPSGQKGKSSSLKLAELSFLVETHRQFTLIEDPKVVLEDIYLKVEYKAGTSTALGGTPTKSSISATVLGHLTIGKSVLVEIAYVKRGDVHVFAVQADVNRTKKLNGPAVVGTFLKSDDHDLSRLGDSADFPINHIALVFEPKKSIEIAAYGSAPWTGRCSGVDFALRNIGVRVRVECLSADPAKPDQKKYNCDIFAYGQLDMPGFMSAKAMLNVQHGRDSILTATLNPSSGDGDTELVQLTGKVPHDGGNWADLAVQPRPLRFATGGQLIVNFTTGLFFVRGQIEGVGHAILLVKKGSNADPPSDRSCIYFDFQAASLDQIWQSDELKSELTDVVAINRVEVKVLTCDTTTEALRVSLEECDRILQQNMVAVVTGTDILKAIEPAPTKPSPSPPTKPPSITMKDGEPLTAGATFIAELGLKGSGELMEGMIQTTDPAGPAPTISLFAHFSKSDRRYKLYVQQWRFADGMIVIREASGEYLPALSTPEPRKAQFSIKAEVDVQHIECALKLRIGLITSAGQTVVRGEVSTAIVSNVFKDMFNVTMTNLQMEGVFSKTKKTLSIRSRVTLGPAGKPDEQSLWVGEIHFRGGKPSVAMIEYDSVVKAEDRSLTGADAFSDLVKTGKADDPAPDWPADLPAFKFLNAYVYYNALDQFEHEKRVYRPGFWLGAQVELFHAVFEVQAHIRSDRSGMTITAGLLQPVDFDFVKFTGPKLEQEAKAEQAEPETNKEIQRAPGPLLRVEAQKNPTFLVSTGVVFLDTTLPDIQFGWDGERKAIFGTVSFTEGVMTGTSIKLYYKDKHFWFEGWDVFRNDLNVDINGAIQKGSQGQPCKALVEKIFKEAIKSKFIFPLNAPKDRAKLIDADGLHLEVKWQAEFSVLGKVVGSVSIKDLTLTFHRPFKVSGIWARLAQEVAANIAEIGVAILADPVVFGKLLALVGSEKLAIETLNRIFCRKVTDKDWTQKIRKYTNAKWNEILKQLKEVWDLIQKIKEHIIAGELVAAFLAFVDAAGLILPLLILIPALIILILYLIDLAIEENDKKTKEELEKLKESIQRALDKLKQGHKDLSKDIGKTFFSLGGASIRFADGSVDTVIVTWNKMEVPSDKGDITFKATFATNDKFEHAEPVVIDDHNATSVSHKNTDYQFATDVHVRLEADLTLRYTDGTDEDGKVRTGEVKQHVEYDVVASHVAELLVPTDLTFRLTDGDARQPEAKWKAAGTSTRFELLVHAVSSTDRLPLYRGFVDATGPDGGCVATIDLCSTDPAGLKADRDEVVYRVMAVPTDEVRYKNSQWVECPTSIPTSRFIQELKADSAGAQIALSWKEIVCSQYRIRLYQTVSTVLARKVITVTDGQAGRLGCRVRVPDNLADDAQLYAAVEAVDVPPEMCPVWCQTSVAVSSRPPVTITDEAYKTAITLPTGELRLVVTMPWSFIPAVHKLSVIATRKDQGDQPIEAERVTFSPSRSGRAGQIRIARFAVPYPTHLTVSTERVGGSSTPVRGPPWPIFATPKEALPVVTGLQCRIEDGRLCVLWQYPPGLERVQLWVTSGERTVTRNCELKDPSAPHGEVHLEGFSVTGPDETVFDVRVVSMYGTHVFGADQSMSWLAPPPYTIWRAPRETETELRSNVAVLSGLTAVSRARISTLFWFEETNKLMAGGHGYVLELASGQPSSIAATSLGPDHEEVVFANSQSTLSTVRSTIAAEAKPIFNPSPSSLGHGLTTTKHSNGSLTAAADRSTGTSHLWWVATSSNPGKQGESAVWYAFRHRDGDWSEPSMWAHDGQAVYVDENGASPLAAAVMDGFATVYYHSASDGLVSATRQLVTDNGRPQPPAPSSCFCMHDFWEDASQPEEYSVEPSAGLTVIRWGSKNLLFWITKQGALMSSRDTPAVMATDPRGKGRVKGSRTGDAEAAPPGSAAARSGIAAVWTPAVTAGTAVAGITAAGGGGSDNVPEAKELHLFFFAPDGRLMGGRGTVGDWNVVSWSFYELAPAGSGPAEGSMPVLLTAWDQPLVRIWWLNNKRRIQWQVPVGILQGPS